MVAVPDSEKGFETVAERLIEVAVEEPGGFPSACLEHQEPVSDLPRIPSNFLFVLFVLSVLSGRRALGLPGPALGIDIL